MYLRTHEGRTSIWHLAHTHANVPSMCPCSYTHEQLMLFCGRGRKVSAGASPTGEAPLHNSAAVRCVCGEAGPPPEEATRIPGADGTRDAIRAALVACNAFEVSGGQMRLALCVLRPFTLPLGPTKLLFMASLNRQHGRHERRVEHLMRLRAHPSGGRRCKLGQHGQHRGQHFPRTSSRDAHDPQRRLRRRTLSKEGSPPRPLEWEAEGNPNIGSCFKSVDMRNTCIGNKKMLVHTCLRMLMTGHAQGHRHVFAYEVWKSRISRRHGKRACESKPQREMLHLRRMWACASSNAPSA